MDGCSRGRFQPLNDSTRDQKSSDVSRNNESRRYLDTEHIERRYRGRQHSMDDGGPDHSPEDSRQISNRRSNDDCHRRGKQDEDSSSGYNHNNSRSLCDRRRRKAIDATVIDRQSKKLRGASLVNGGDADARGNGRIGRKCRDNKCDRSSRGQIGCRHQS